MKKKEQIKVLKAQSAALEKELFASNKDADMYKKNAAFWQSHRDMESAKSVKIVCANELEVFNLRERASQNWIAIQSQNVILESVKELLGIEPNLTFDAIIPELKDLIALKSRGEFIDELRNEVLLSKVQEDMSRDILSEIAEILNFKGAFDLMPSLLSGELCKHKGTIQAQRGIIEAQKQVIENFGLNAPIASDQDASFAAKQAELDLKAAIAFSKALNEKMSFWEEIREIHAAKLIELHRENLELKSKEVCTLEQMSNCPNCGLVCRKNR